MSINVAHILVGDWVRFYRDGKMVIGVVQYPPEKDIVGVFVIKTDIGTVSFNSVLEHRGRM